MTVKQRLHRLVDELPEPEMHTAERVLEALKAAGDPLVRALTTAPADDEAETLEEAEAVREAMEDVEAGRVVPHLEARRRLLGKGPSRNS